MSLGFIDEISRIRGIQRRDLVESWSLVLRHHIYEADALQISATKEARCDILLTADRRLVQAAREEGIEAIDIEAEPEQALKHISKNT